MLMHNCIFTHGYHRVSADKVTVTTEYPGLGAQYSSDNGSTWQNTSVNHPTTVTWNQAGSILLRATYVMSCFKR